MAFLFDGTKCVEWYSILMLAYGKKLHFPLPTNPIAL